jgi:hypothetical protein
MLPPIPRLDGADSRFVGDVIIVFLALETLKPGVSSV